MPKILIIEDEPSIRTIINKYLSKFDITCLEASNGKKGLDLYIKEKDSIDLILMDVMMPVMDGVTCTKEIRKISDVPIIILTAKNQDEDEIEGLEVGANDFITKPFNLDVLLLRIKKFIKLDGNNELELLKDRRAINKNGRIISLTKKEYLILEYFFENPNIVLTRDQILNHVWGIDYFGDDRVVDTNIKRIRKKVDDERKYIKTSSGTGYIFIK
ncbi:MAG: response regulator transcription factor [Bacilli bacterium]|nr:response regulator transcription factor [Bacilli bacterium]